MPLHRYDLASQGRALSALAALLIAAAAPAYAGSHACCAHGSRACAAKVAVACAPATQAAASTAPMPAPVAAAAPAAVAAPVWLPEWIGPAPESDVPDYALLYRPPVPTAPGMIIAIDPETGHLVAPTEAQRRAIALGAKSETGNLLESAGAPMTLERLPNGGEVLQLNGNFQSYSIARIGPDGRIVTDCAHDAASAKRLLAQPAPKPALPRAEKE
jgi:hypothetical protein